MPGVNELKFILDWNIFPSKLKVNPSLIELTLIDPVGFEQVGWIIFKVAAVGAVIFWVIVWLAVLVHPLEPVTVTV